MTTHVIPLSGDPGAILRAWPWPSGSLAAAGVQATPVAGKLGQFTITLDDAVSILWRVFVGASAPAHWNLYLYEIDLTDRGRNWNEEERDYLATLFGIDAPDPPDMLILPELPPVPGHASAYLVCLDQTLEPEPDVTVYFRMVRGPGDSGYSYDTPVRQAVSDANGLTVLTPVPQGSTIEYWRGNTKSSRKNTAVIDNNPTMALPELL
jgi:hypothetical protein